MFIVEQAPSSPNMQVELWMDDGGAGKVGHLVDGVPKWTTSADYNITTAAIVEALNGRYSLPQDGVFVTGYPYLAGLVSPSNIIE